MPKIPAAAFTALHNTCYGIRYGTVSLICEVNTGHYETCQTKTRETFCGSESTGRVYNGEIPQTAVKEIETRAAEFSGSLELVLSIRDGQLQYYEIICSRIPVKAQTNENE
jgi:hypothetical protein